MNGTHLLSLSHSRKKTNNPLFIPLLSSKLTLATVLILAICWMHVIYEGSNSLHCNSPNGKVVGQIPNGNSDFLLSCAPEKTNYIFLKS